VSIPEQNETVKELAGPSQYLLPATSKAASGSSSLNTSFLTHSLVLILSLDDTPLKSVLLSALAHRLALV
jgi:hypothetical protein